MFDGKIARTKKNRTEVEKRFGIQIDSLADIICFGVAPSLIAYRMGMNHFVGIAITFSVFLCFILADLFGHVKPCQTDQSCQHIEHKNRYAYNVIHSHAICCSP